MGDFSDQLREAIRAQIESYIESDDVECPNCHSSALDSKVREGPNGFTGLAICHDCDSEIELNLQEDESFSELNNALNDLEDTLDSF